METKLCRASRSSVNGYRVIGLKGNNRHVVIGPQGLRLWSNFLVIHTGVYGFGRGLWERTLGVN